MLFNDCWCKVDTNRIDTARVLPSINTQMEGFDCLIDGNTVTFSVYIFVYGVIYTKRYEGLVIL